MIQSASGQILALRYRDHINEIDSAWLIQVISPLHIYHTLGLSKVFMYSTQAFHAVRSYISAS